MNRIQCGLLGAVLAIMGASPGEAQEPRGVSPLSAGMHDFNQGRLFEAIQHFDAAAASDARDPRIYFFRGLAKRRLGWTGDADVDLRLGAQMEVALKRRDVGRALQRIQGPERLWIERYRREARQLPEAVVRRVVPRERPQPAATTVQPPSRGDSAPSRRMQFVPSQLANDTTDPFAGSSADRLGRGAVQAPAAPTVRSPSPQAPTAAADDPFQDGVPATRRPFGSGVADRAAAPPDPFAAPPASDRAAAAGSGIGEGRGVFGAMLRALTRSVAPVDELVEQGSGFMEGARTVIPGAGPPGGGPAPAPSAAAPFGTPGADRADGPADIFNDEPAAPPADGAEDPLAEDPFTDDPFLDDSVGDREPPAAADSPGDSPEGEGPEDGSPEEADMLFDFDGDGSP